MGNFYYNLYISIFLFVGVASGMLSWLNLKINQDNITKIEKLPRERKFGFAIGILALLWCVPHAQAIIFNFLAPYLYYIAAVLGILSYFFLDYLFARALGGALIICGYYSVHAAFDYHSKMSIIITVLAWLIGICGIFISGKPSLFRDVLRKSAKNKKFKISLTLFLAIISVCFILNGVLEILK